MDESILNSIKKMLGITKEYTNFDQDIIMHINSVFMILNQLGVGPSKPYSIINDKNLWSEFISEEEMIHSVKTYIYLKVRLMFDPPSNSSLIESINKQIAELEWRLNVAYENNKKEGEEESGDV